MSPYTHLTLKDRESILLGVLPANRVRTVTPDRGREFARYRELAERLNTKNFFPDPHAPQQRGTNENTNGLIREYFPKNTDLDLQSDQEIETYIEQLNNWPRKVLGWKTPSEVFMGKKLHLSWQFVVSKTLKKAGIRKRETHLKETLASEVTSEMTAE